MHAFRKLCFHLLSLMALTIVVGGPGGTGASAQGQATIAVMPPSSQVEVDQATEVEIRVEDVTGLYGLDVRLTFDPSVVQVVDSDDTKAGLQVTSGDLLQPDFLIRNTADNSQGTVWFAVTQLNPTAEVDGSGTAFIVAFRGVRAAACALQITYTRLVGRDGESISPTTLDGEIEVISADGAAPPPLPTAPEKSSTPPAPPTIGLTPTTGTRAEQTPPGTSTAVTVVAQPTAAPQAPANRQGSELSVPLILAGMAGVLVVAGGVFAIWLLRARAAD